MQVAVLSNLVWLKVSSYTGRICGMNHVVPVANSALWVVHSHGMLIFVKTPAI